MSKTNAVPTEEQTARAALKRVNDALTSKREIDDKDRLAMNFLNREVRRGQLLQSRDKLQWSVARMFVDATTLEKYKKATMPVIQKILNP